MRIILGIISFTVLLFGSSISSAEDNLSFIRLKNIEGRTWLVRPDGNPFFAHGVTHVGNGKGIKAVDIGKACKSLGFNAYGYGCANQLKTDLPFVEGHNFVPISLYRTSDASFGFVDIFDPKVQAKYEQDVANTCFANRKNPNLIGYCWTDLAAWPLKNSTGKNWVNFIRSLPKDAPGQKAYRRFLATSKANNDKERDLNFLRRIAREYFRVFGEANRKFDPDHLVFGDRLTFETAIPEVLEEMLPYIDAIAIQPNFKRGFPKQQFERMHKLSNKPILICDYAIRFKDGDKKVRAWKPEENSQIAGTHYAEYVRQAFATPYILGVFWCNPVDSKPGFKKTGIKQGLFNQDLSPRPGLNQSIQELNQFLVQKTPKQK